MDLGRDLSKGVDVVNIVKRGGAVASSDQVVFCNYTTTLSMGV